MWPPGICDQRRFGTPRICDQRHEDQKHTQKLNQTQRNIYIEADGLRILESSMSQAAYTVDDSGSSQSCLKVAFGNRAHGAGGP